MPGTVLQIIPASVYPVGMHRLWIIPKPLPVALNLFDQLPRLVEIVPAHPVDEGVSPTRLTEIFAPNSTGIPAFPLTSLPGARFFGVFIQNLFTILHENAIYFIIIKQIATY
jgi:hypothetical protein